MRIVKGFGPLEIEALLEIEGLEISYEARVEKWENNSSISESMTASPAKTSCFSTLWRLCISEIVHVRDYGSCTSGQLFR